MKQKHMVFVPYWVKSVLGRHGLAFTEVLNYAKIRAVLSERELGAFLSLQRTEKIGLLKKCHNGHLLSSWELSCPADAKAELDSVVVPLSYSKDVIEDVEERLALDPTLVKEGADEKFYEIIDFERDAMAIVLKPGCFAQISAPTGALDFARALLRIFYGYLEFHEVAALVFYQEYLWMLRKQVPQV